MDKERICIMITGAICMLGCAFIAIFNLVDAYYGKADIIPQRDYHQAVAIVSPTEETGVAPEHDTININTASAGQIAEFLPGIGEKKAKSIVEYRENAGGFASVDELIEVDGIGEKTLQNIRPYCRVED